MHWTILLDLAVYYYEYEGPIVSALAVAGLSLLLWHLSVRRAHMEDFLVWMQILLPFIPWTPFLAETVRDDPEPLFNSERWRARFYWNRYRKNVYKLELSFDEVMDLHEREGVNYVFLAGSPYHEAYKETAENHYYRSELVPRWGPVSDREVANYVRN